MITGIKRSVPKLKFTQEEDDLLIEVIERMGTRDWEGVAQEMKHRTPRQCRERWNNYLSPSITSDPWSKDEEKLLSQLYSEYGSKWSKIAEFFPNRSANGIRNRYKMMQRRIAKEQRKAEKQKIKQMSGKTRDAKIINVQPLDALTNHCLEEFVFQNNSELFELIDDEKDIYHQIFNM